MTTLNNFKPQHQRRVCGHRTAGTAQDIPQEDPAGGDVSIAGPAAVRSGQPPLPDPRRDVQQPEATALGFGPDALPSVPGARVRRRSGGNQVS